MAKHPAFQMLSRVATALSENDRLRNALINLRDGMRGNDDDLNNDDRPGGARSPDGDNYNDLFDLVQDALKAAGIPYREGEAA